jgi:hypothetical protein
MWANVIKPFYQGNLRPLNGNTVIPCHKTLFPWQLNTVVRQLITKIFYNIGTNVKYEIPR